VNSVFAVATLLVIGQENFGCRCRKIIAARFTNIYLYVLSFLDRCSPIYSRVRLIVILRYLLRGLRVVFTTARLQAEKSLPVLVR
jgi:hypothetical protein